MKLHCSRRIWSGSVSQQSFLFLDGLSEDSVFPIYVAWTVALCHLVGVEFVVK